MENINEKALKARKTTLSKKSVEQLINIILRKDSVERQKNKKIETLTEKIEDISLKLDEKTVRYDDCKRIIHNLESKLKKVNDSNNDLTEKLGLLNTKSKIKKFIIIVLVIMVILLLIVNLNFLCI